MNIQQILWYSQWVAYVVVAIALVLAWWRPRQHLKMRLIMFGIAIGIFAARVSNDLYRFL